MRISDWSSDVCSSDLLGTVDLAPDQEITLGAETEYTALSQFTPAVAAIPEVEEHTRNDALFLGYAGTFFDDLTISLSGRVDDDQDFGTELKIGSASCRESVCQYV